MNFSEEEVYIIGAFIALLTSALIWILLGNMLLKQFWSHKRNGSIKEAILLTFLGCPVGALMYYLASKFLYYPSAILFITIGTVLECIMYYVYLKPINRHYIEENIKSLNSDELSVIYRKPNFMVYYILVVIIIFNSSICMGGIALTQWMMPNVVEIHNGNKRAWYGYNVNEYYVLPFDRGMAPGGCYIDNLSKDTVYRVVINYGFPGEERYNLYAVQGKYPPNSLTKLPSRAHHVMDTIAPIMPPSRGRNGRYRTQRVYLTDIEHLWDFKMVKMRKFGLERNIRVDSIIEDRNQLVRENYEKYRAYKKIDSLPYPRLRPIPDRIIKSDVKDRVNK